MSSVLSTMPWLRDPNVVNVPWRREIVDSTHSRAASNGAANEQTLLKLGIYWNDGVVTPQPPIDRGLHAVVKAVEDAGHKVGTSIGKSKPLHIDEGRINHTCYQVVEWSPPCHTTAKRVHVSICCSRFHL